MATVDHKFNKDLQAAQPDDVQLREHERARDLGPGGWNGDRRRLRAGGQRPRRHAVQRRAAQSALHSPAEPRPQHLRLHARQPDRADGEVRHRAVRPHLPARRRVRLRELLEPELLSATGPATALPCRRRSAATSGYTGCVPAGFHDRVEQPGQRRRSSMATWRPSQAYTAAGYFNDTIQVLPWLKLVGGLRLRLLTTRRSATRMNSANIFGSTTIALRGAADHLPQQPRRRDRRADAGGSRTTSPTARRSIRRSSSSSRRPARSQPCRRSRTRLRSSAPSTSLLNGNLVAARRAVPDHQDQCALAECRRHVQRHRHGPRQGRADRRRRPHHARMAGVRRLHLPRWPHHRRHRRRHHGHGAAQHAEGLGDPLDDLHVQGNLRDRRRRHLCRAALRQQHQQRRRCRTSPGST